MRGDHCPEQEPRGHRPAEGPADAKAGRPGNGKGKEAESGCRALVLLEDVQVELEPGDEHEVEQRPWAPIAKPPRMSPIRPGIPNRERMIGPRRITENSTRNSKMGPCACPIVVSTSVLRPDQRHVFLALAEPPRDELVDRAVGLQASDRGIDDLDIARPLRQGGGKTLVNAELTEHLEDDRIVLGQAEGDRQVEEKCICPTRTQDLESP